LKKTGYKKGMSLGLLIMAVGTLMFLPAAYSRNYVLFLTGLFITGTGLALLQTASNPYLTVLGPIESAGSRISIMGICNKVAGIIASMIFGYIALGDADNITASLPLLDPVQKAVMLDELAARVIVPYIIITLVLAALAVGIYYSALPDIEDSSEPVTGADPQNKKTSILQFPHLLLGVLAIFLYLGVEVLAGDTIISYGKSLNIPLATAKFFTTATLACMLVGYTVGIVAIPKYLSQQNALKWCAILGVIFSAAALFTHGYASVLFIALLGLANSLMWPAIFPLAIDGLNKFTKQGAALLIMGIGGGAVIPLIYGALADHSTHSLISEGLTPNAAKATASRNAYWITIPCYLFILYYSILGYRAGKRK